LHFDDCLDERCDWRQFHVGLFRSAHYHRLIFYAEPGAWRPQRVSYQLSINHSPHSLSETSHPTVPRFFVQFLLCLIRLQIVFPALYTSFRSVPRGPLQPRTTFAVPTRDTIGCCGTLKSRYERDREIDG